MPCLQIGEIGFESFVFGMFNFVVHRVEIIGDIIAGRHRFEWIPPVSTDT